MKITYFLFVSCMKMSPRLQFEITLHGFLLWASMGFLMPVGILAIRLSNREENPRWLRVLFYVHTIFQASIVKIYMLLYNSLSDLRIYFVFFWLLLFLLDIQLYLNIYSSISKISVKLIIF